MPSLLFSVLNISAAPHHNIVVGISMSSSHSLLWLIISICFDCGEMVGGSVFVLISGRKCSVLKVLALVLSVF